MIFKKDNLKLGLVLGLTGPLLGLVIIYFVKYSGWTFYEFFDNLINSNKMLTAIGSLSLFANVILFTFYVNTRRDQTAKGIFIFTLIYGIAILMLKVFN